MGQRGDDDSRADRVDASAPSTPNDGLRLHPQHIAALAHLIGIQRLVDGADERQVEQFVDRGERELGVLFRGQGVQTVARLGTDHDA